MDKNRNSSKLSKKSTSKSEARTSLSSVAKKLKGKELFPEKVEKAKLFFSKLEPAKK